MKNKSHIIIFSFILLVVLVGGMAICYNILFPLKFEEDIKTLAKENQLDKGLVASIIYAESRFNEKAQSSKGALGLMQLMPTTAESFYDGEDFSSEILFNGKINIEIGCRFLRYLFNKYEDEVMVLACYNAGETIARTWVGENNTLELDEIKYKETMVYVEKVQRYKNFYSNRLN